MKDILLNIIQTDTSYNKSATRYLYKTYPEYWQQILEKTSFLPDTAKPKQRVWHIINDTYEIPKCPITHKYVKWWENRYLETLNPSAAILLQYQRGDFVNGHTPEVNAKRSKSNKEAVTRGRKYRDSKTYTAADREKAKQTWIKKYGVDNPSKDKAVQEKIYQRAVTRGCTPKHLRSLRRLYYDAVWRFTEQSWRDHFDVINPTRLNRTYNALDHIYSIQQGFRDCIPPYIIGHYTNLRVISLSENSIKGMQCDKTQNQLFEDFFSCINPNATILTIAAQTSDPL
jgi:hypothetical protein